MRGKPDKTRSASHQAVGIVAGCGASALSGLPITIQSVLFHKLRFQFHRTKTVDFAIDVMVAFNQADVFHFGANFQHRRATFHLQIFNDGNAVAVSQQIAVSIFNDRSIRRHIPGRCTCRYLRRCIRSCILGSVVMTCGFPQKSAGQKRQKTADCRKRPQLYTKSLSLSGVLLILDDDRFHLKGNAKRK